MDGGGYFEGPFIFWQLTDRGPIIYDMKKAPMEFLQYLGQNYAILGEDTFWQARIWKPAPTPPIQYSE